LAALTAFWFFLFSSFGTHPFNDVFIPLLIVPAIWFFYCAVSLANRPSMAGLLGLTFWSMVVAITYMPFYFLSAFLCFLVVYILLFAKEGYALLRQLWKFVLEHRGVALGCLFALLVALTPGALWLLDSSREGLVVGSRISSAGTDPLAISLQMINNSAVSANLSLDQLFGNYWAVYASTFYVPALMLILLSFGAFARMTRRRVLLLIWASLIFLISLGDASPLHKFLYDHVLFFHFFRNLVYVLWFAVPVVCLLTADFIDTWLAEAEKRPRAVWLVFIVPVLLAWAAVFWHIGAAWSSFWALAMSALLALWFVAGREKFDLRWAVVLVLLAVLVPMVEVSDHFRVNSAKIVAQYTRAPHARKEFKPVFSFYRPSLTEEQASNRVDMFADVKDTSGFGDEPFRGSRRSYFLFKTIDRSVLEKYVHYKFVLYDGVEAVDESQVDTGYLTNIFSFRSDKAMVSGKGAASAVGAAEHVRPPVRIEKGSPEIQVIGFDLNKVTLKVSLKEKKFLVYNDSYHFDWSAAIDGRPAQIFRANVAFKGVWIDAGEHIVDFRFRPWWRYVLVVVTYVAFWSIFGAWIAALGRERQRRK
jgi:hypothetical protein